MNADCATAKSGHKVEQKSFPPILRLLNIAETQTLETLHPIRVKRAQSQPDIARISAWVPARLRSKSSLPHTAMNASATDNANTGTRARPRLVATAIDNRHESVEVRPGCCPDHDG